MRDHLTDAEMAAQIAGSLQGEGLIHLGDCPACREEWVRLRADLGLLAMAVRAEADRPETFFRAQRTRIVGRLGERRFPSRPWQTAWAPAVAAALILAVLLTRGEPPLDPSRELGADQTLLSTVQHAIHAGVPTPLQPAALLTTEVERGLPHPDRGDKSTKGDPS
jgi:hypothetical protein